LRIVHVHSPVTELYPEAFPLNDESFDSELKTRQRAYLEDVVRRIPAAVPVPASFDVLEGPVVPMIQEEARRVKADLVVMTTHGRGPMARFWLGSVADQLVRDLPAPLLLVRPGDAAMDWGREPAFRHILVPLDGSPLAEDIIEPALAVGNLTNAEFTLLCVTPTLLPPVGAPELAYGPGIQALAEGRLELEDKLRREAQGYLDKVDHRLRLCGAKVQTRVVTDVQPGTAILHEAKAIGADLIALATHARHGIARLLVGSVADKVIRGCTLPVLVHRPKET
jgi:nucleotide-binding universal stress UspA family protein